MPALHLANLSLPHQLLSCCYTDFGQGAVEAESQGAAVAVIVATG